MSHYYFYDFWTTVCLDITKKRRQRDHVRDMPTVVGETAQTFHCMHTDSFGQTFWKINI